MCISFTNTDTWLSYYQGNRRFTPAEHNALSYKQTKKGSCFSRIL
ncbi:hypothetical protein HMPREF0766_10602 [Sphingobacterium spiritivorum ATCC 33861]|uniref:Uncharacterized protein n=1 Tax=Sphingobacterium spiritivorum ATCC 33861 TaxID=525373 RepID=D7VHY3_SPHSI|nr:hypothetical protein HMPREF0766_10602 [Sphingobacterium spiritivorum ATCC 33861]